MVESSNETEVLKPTSASGHFVVITAVTALFVSTLDTGVINVAMPTLVTVFHYARVFV